MTADTVSVNDRFAVTTPALGTIATVTGPLNQWSGSTNSGPSWRIEPASEADVIIALGTRLGFNSKAVVTGDVTQIDLQSKKLSGLADAVKILEGQKGISFFHFASKDVVRHNLVQSIIDAYEKNSENNED